jgi:hypothetical protein
MQRTHAGGRRRGLHAGSAIPAARTRNERNVYEEWQRNANYVVLVDPKRKIYLRCYADHLDIFNNQQKWVTLYKGSWAGVTQ